MRPFRWQPLVTVSMEVAGGSSVYVGGAATLFEAVRDGWKHFQGDGNHGPRPTLDTLFTVHVRHRRQTFHVIARRALEGDDSD
ncbi:MAG: hypothetical protein HY820_24350 [Acidobacteria bacterium]|nr:hypothetical protein [Acidobacteriota bacterium]